MLKVRFFWIAVLLASVVVTGMFAQEQNEKPQNLGAEVFMRVKLSSSREVLEGLATRDFSLVEKGARQLKEMSEASKWPKAKDTLYEHYGVEFRRLCEKLSQLSKQENVEASAYVFQQLTASCISCHEHVYRNLRPAKDPANPFQLIPTVPK